STPLGGAVTRRRIRKIPTLNDDWVMRLSDDGMSWSGKRGEGRVDWSGFSRARRFADGLLLFQGPHLFYWFPDSACTPAGTAVRRRRSGEASRFRLPRRRAACFIRRNTNGARLDAGDGQRSRLMTADQFAQLRDAWGPVTLRRRV